jgi:hypothetical protein
MDGKHLVITGTLTVDYREIPTHALIDCRATGIWFIDQDFARNHQIPIQDLKDKKQVEVIDGRPIESGDITHIAKVGMKIQDHGEQLPMLVTKLRHYPIGRGIPWLQLHDVAGHFVSNTISFGSQYCITHCRDSPVAIQGVTEESLEPGYGVENVFKPQIRQPRPF